ncbi:ligand-binding sensor domain-containing protein [Pedobacter sp. P26]|uniref:ligand-binding sensor domain-containing protein n=1 Tax=Pedobacter sp. P26 TaxID=3423956 RepID=UPI003D67D52A
MPNLYEKYLFVLLLTILLFSKSLYGANEAPIKYLGIAQGLSNNMATCVFRDHYGFMWIGTYNGLNRYDGVAVKIFEKDLKDPKSLVSNHITCITGDTHNKIWIGTNKGLAIYDYANGKILTATLNKGRASNKTNILKKVNAIVSDPKGDVYVGTSGGFLVVKKGTNNCEQIKIKTSTNFNVQALTIDKNGRIWLFVEYMGLGIYDRKSNEVRIINSQLKTLSTMTADPRNENLWLGEKAAYFSLILFHIS